MKIRNYTVFFYSIKAMDVNLGDDEIVAAWDDVHATGYMVEGYDFNGITIGYIPYKELSKGHSNLRIDMTFPVE